MANTHNNLEEYIKTMYQSININDPGDLRPDEIIKRLGYSLQYVPTPSMRIDDVLYIDSRLPQNQQWQEFGRLLCHLSQRQSNHLNTSHEEATAQQEQAQEFAYYACIPSSMLVQVDSSETQLQTVHRIAKLFNVTTDFATQRLAL